MKRRVSLAFGPTVPYDDILYGTKLADELGFESVWVSEGWGADSLVTSTSLALATKKIRLGMGVLNVFSRSPSSIAMATASLDMVSNVTPSLLRPSDIRSRPVPTFPSK